MRTATTAVVAAALLAVGGAAGAALSAGPGHPPVATVAAAPAPVEVRTQVIHRTVHVVRHLKPKRARRPAPPPAAVVAPARAQPVTAAVAPRSARPLSTRSSATGSGGGEREHEHEGGDDD